MKNPWIISVLSTAYDLKEYRKAIIDMLKRYRIEVSAYEIPEFPVETNMHTHESCLVALRRVDIAIVIIDKRRGDIFHGIDDAKQQISITEAEYLEAIKRKIPVFSFVKKETQNELFRYKKKFDSYCKDKNITNTEDRKKLVVDFDKAYECDYVEDVKTLHFVDNIQNAYEKYMVSNWIDSFTDIDNMLCCIEGKLKGYSRDLLQKLSEKQNNYLLNRHTSTAIGMSLRDVFSSEYYIESPYRIDSGEGLVNSASTELSNVVDEVLLNCNSVLIYGEAGYGKTTVIAKCFSEYLEKMKNEPTYIIPMFFLMRNKGSNYSFDVKEYINDEIEGQFGKEPYPFLSIKDIKLCFFCDGFDELAESLSEEDIERIRESIIFEYPLVLTCRQRLVNKYLNVHNFSDTFGMRIQMKKWDIETVEKYVINFLKKKNKNEDEINKVILQIKENRDIQQLIDSPLLITMFMWFLENINNGQQIDDLSCAALFENWMNGLSNREHTKNKGISSEEILCLWKTVAWNLYLFRRKNEKLHREDVVELIKTVLPKIDYKIAISTLDALFEWKNDILSGVFHEQFMEFLVADYLICACVSKKDPYPEFMKLVIRPEINRYFREIWNTKSKTKRELIYKAISNQYFENVGKTDEESILIRVHAVYHMCRLQIEDRKKDMERVFETENNVSVLLSLYFGAIKMGWLDKEEEFYNLLQNPEYSRANRGYHLTYYDDIIPNGTLPYEDDNVSLWNGTLRAFERHFKSKKMEHFFLHRIDLYTMKELIISRKSVLPLNSTILSEFESIINSCEYANQPQNIKYAEAIRKEYVGLINVYEHYC